MAVHKRLFYGIRLLAGLVLLLGCQLPVYGQSPFLSDTSLAAVETYFSSSALKVFYRENSFRLAWFSQQELKPAADSLLGFIYSAEAYGLLPLDYQPEKLKALQQHCRSGQASRKQIEQADILFSNSFFALAYHLRHGRVHKESFLRLPFLPQAASGQLAGLLKQFVEGAYSLRMLLEQQQPSHLSYILLREELARLWKDGNGSFSHVTAEQDRTIRQLTLNLERWRWEEDSLPFSYLLVNIPAYRLQLIEQGLPVLDSRVIVGSPATPSPVLDGLLECLVTYPYWTVPRSIAVYEILPKLQQDPSYLQKNHFQVLDPAWKRVNPAALDWKRYSPAYFPFILRQSEGPHNAMGVVKFMFDNPYAVYLHDTNAPHLFQKHDRALSHGCIRVEKWRELAQYLLRNDSTFGQPGEFDQLLETRRRTEVSLPRGVPLYIRYFTAAYEQDSLFLYQDVYRQDEKLIRALFAE